VQALIQNKTSIQIGGPKNVLKIVCSHPLELIGISLLALYFGFQPWNIYIADYFWVTLSLFSIAILIQKKIAGLSLNTPKDLKTILWLFAAMPLVSIISYISSPLDTLRPELLEPDIRWLLIIPIILVFCTLRIKAIWILGFLSIYAISSFISAIQETHYLSKIWIRANGNENAVPFGMFSATISVLLLTFFLSRYIKEISTRQNHIIVIRILVFIMFIMASAVTFLSGTRAAIALIPIIVSCLYMSHYNVKKAFIILVALLGTSFLFVMSQPNSAFVKRISGTQADVLSYFIKNDITSKLKNPRLEEWKESWCIFKKHPIAGTGPRSFRQAHQLYGGKEECNSTQQYKNGSFQAHSVYFNTLSTLGIMGLALLAFTCLRLVKTAWLSIKSNTASIKLGGMLLIIAIACLAINGITLDLWFRIHVIDKNLLIIALPLIIIFQHQSQETTSCHDGTYSKDDTKLRSS
jgi:O-antigen ligase